MPAGIIDRDLKPGKVMISGAPDRSAFVKVFDFGVAKPTSLPDLLDSVVGFSLALRSRTCMLWSPGLQFDGSAEVGYTVAGHPPFLHYRRSKRDVIRCAMQQFPPGPSPELPKQPTGCDVIRETSSLS
jgi:hypothetical protein